MTGEADFTFRVDPSSVDKCSSALDDLKQRMHVANSRATASGIAAVQRRSKEAASGAPGPKVITGRLRDSIWVEGPEPSGDSRFSAKVGPTVIYGRIQELGGTIVPKTKKTLFWIGDDGQPHFAMRVTLPPRPYMRPGLSSAMPEIQDAYASEWGKATSSDYQEGFATPSPPPPPEPPFTHSAKFLAYEEAQLHDVMREGRSSYEGEEFKPYGSKNVASEPRPESEMEAWRKLQHNPSPKEMAESQERFSRLDRKLTSRPGTSRTPLRKFHAESGMESWDAYNQALARFAKRHPSSGLISALRDESPRVVRARKATENVTKPVKAAAKKAHHGSGFTKKVRGFGIRRIL